MNTDDIPDKIKRTIYISISIETLAISADSFDYSNVIDTSIPIATTEIEVNIDKSDIKNKIINKLKERKQVILAEAHVQAEQIQDKINSLLSLEYIPNPSNINENDEVLPPLSKNTDFDDDIPF